MPTKHSGISLKNFEGKHLKRVILTVRWPLFLKQFHHQCYQLQKHAVRLNTYCQKVYCTNRKWNLEKLMKLNVLQTLQKTKDLEGNFPSKSLRKLIPSWLQMSNQWRTKIFDKSFTLCPFIHQRKYTKFYCSNFSFLPLKKAK